MGYFNPRSLCRERPCLKLYVKLLSNFNPRSLCRERLAVGSNLSVSEHFNPRSLCRERLCGRSGRQVHFFISIHAPYAGSDTPGGNNTGRKGRFQSTLPMQGATPMQFQKSALVEISIHAPYAGSDHNPFNHMCRNFNFNPRSLCRERQVFATATIVAFAISIHAPYAGSDVKCRKALTKVTLFQSTLPMQGAT